MPCLGRLIGIFIGTLLCNNMATAKHELPISVEGVSFNRARLPHSSAIWLETAIELRGVKNTKKAIHNPRFIDAIAITVTLAYASEAKGPSDLTFFQASAQMATLEQGHPVSVYFYLPPEVRKRDRLRDRPYAYLIELSVDGEPLPSVDEHRSASLNTAQALKRFRDQRAEKAPQNQGILQAIHTTLFWNAALYPERMKTIPSFRSLKQANP